MRITTAIAAALVFGFLFFAAACGGDSEPSEGSDTTAATSTADSAASSDPAPTATAQESAEATAAPTEPPTVDSETIRSVSVGDQTWKIVASVECDFDSETASPLTLISIAGHAEGDESIEIVLAFDPRDTGLTLTVEGTGGEPSWAAINETFVVRAGAISISGEGSFQIPGGGDTTEGSFEASC